MSEIRTTGLADGSETRRILDLLWEVRGFGRSPTREQWESVIVWAEPLRHRDWLDGASSRESANRVLSLAMCALGDAYRETGGPVEAADAYRRSHELDAGPPCADYYAKMVLKHSLTEHYEPAAAALRAICIRWRQRSVGLRAVATFVTFIASPRSTFGWWWDRALRSRRLAELRSRMRALDGAHRNARR